MESLWPTNGIGFHTIFFFPFLFYLFCFFLDLCRNLISILFGLFLSSRSGFHIFLPTLLTGLGELRRAFLYFLFSCFKIRIYLFMALTWALDRWSQILVYVYALNVYWNYNLNWMHQDSGCALLSNHDNYFNNVTRYHFQGRARSTFWISEMIYLNTLYYGASPRRI